jgi:hypothetical protein
VFYINATGTYDVRIQSSCVIGEVSKLTLNGLDAGIKLHSESFGSALIFVPAAQQQ